MFLLFVWLLITSHTHYCLEIIQKPSPNFNERKDKKTHKLVTKPTHIILHYTTDCYAPKSYITLSNFFRPVSAHYLIAANGTIYQLVDESKRAWHAGKSSWRGNKQMNTYSIGIEIVNPGFTESKKDPCAFNQNIWNKNTGIQVQGSSYYWYPFTDQQIQSVIALCQDIMKRYDIKPEFVLAHSDIAPDRKVDPGPLFPWQQLAQHGVGVWPKKSNKNMFQHYSIKNIQNMLATWGYKVPLSDKLDTKTQKVIKAFQMHFRSTNIDGTLDHETITILDQLAG